MSWITNKKKIYKIMFIAKVLHSILGLISSALISATFTLSIACMVYKFECKELNISFAIISPLALLTTLITVYLAFKISDLSFIYDILDKENKDETI